MKKFIYGFMLLAFFVFTFSSCEKEEDCKTCEINIAFVDASIQALYDAAAIAEGYADFQDLTNTVLASDEDLVTVGELCGDAIDDAKADWNTFTEGDSTEDLDGDGSIDITYSYTCE